MTAIEDLLEAYLKTHPLKKGEKESKEKADRRDR